MPVSKDPKDNTYHFNPRSGDLVEVDLFGTDYEEWKVSFGIVTHTFGKYDKNGNYQLWVRVFLGGFENSVSVPESKIKPVLHPGQDWGLNIESILNKYHPLFGPDPGMALEEFENFTLEFIPAEVAKEFEKEKRKKVPPFFSEAFLYPLLGKENARTVLAYFKKLKESRK